MHNARKVTSLGRLDYSRQEYHIACGKAFGLAGIDSLISCLLGQGMVKESGFGMTFGVGIIH